MSTKQKLLICVLTGAERQNWITPLLAANLIKFSADERFAVEVEFPSDAKPFHYARNWCVAKARERGASWLMMCNNDNFFPKDYDPLGVLQRADPDKWVISFPCGTIVGKYGPSPLGVNFGRVLGRDGEFVQAGWTGSGVLAINHRVWGKLPGPWFLWKCADSELAETSLSEDLYFCKKAQASGIRVWVHEAPIGHDKTVDITGFQIALHKAETQH